MFTWLTVRFIAVSSLWAIWHFYGAKKYLQHVKEVKKDDRKN